MLTAVLGLQLTLVILKALEIPIASVRCWSDSMNVLLWIRGRGRDFPPFVSNRIGMIQSRTNPDQWQFVSTQENPADMASRGCGSTQIISSDLCWQVPQFLQKSEMEWMKKIVIKRLQTEQTLSCLQLSNIESPDSNWRLNPQRWSSWLRYSYVFAWVTRFISNCRIKGERRQYGPLTPEEVKESQICIIKDAQKNSYDEYPLIRDGKPLPKKSKLLRLMPRIDEDGVLRCNGRLRYAEFLPYEVRFPAILPHFGN